MNTKDLRDKYAQKRYRDASKSKYKEKKDVSHTLPLDHIKYFRDHTPGPKPNTTLKVVVNDSKNFRMVNSHTNRIVQKNIDRKIIAKAKTGDVLTLKEEKRVRSQVKYIQGNPDIPKGIKNTAIKHYKKLKTKDRRTLYDKRKG